MNPLQVHGDRVLAVTDGSDASVAAAQAAAQILEANVFFMVSRTFL